jgi:SWI/SNF-related matrix-associated actin-dependent regulator of chromatin subfamily A3
LFAAHWIRNSSTLAFKAVEELKGQRRWCLTGTPVQNKLSDLVSLAKFLRYHPFSDASTARDLIIQPLQLGDRTGLDNLRLMMQLFSLRRIKDLKTVPGRQDRVVPVVLSDFERLQYDSTRKQAVARLSKMAHSNRPKTSHIVLQAILRLRQICCQGLKNPYTRGIVESYGARQANECDSCQTTIMCDYDSQKYFIGRCGHKYCESCHLRLHKSIGNSSFQALGICPTCGEAQGTDDDVTYTGEAESALKIHEAPNEQAFQLSSKLAEVLHNLIFLDQTARQDSFLSEKR